MRWLARLHALLARRRHEAELDEELRYHLDRETERNRRRGMSAAAARAAATRAFGNVAEVQDAVRTGWGWRRAGELREDARFALRSFRREPLLILTVLVAIGLGLGPTTAYFTLLNTYFFKPFPVADPESLYELRWNTPERPGLGFSWPRYQRLSGLGAIGESFGYRPVLSRVGRSPVRGALVTGNYFDMLGVGASLGRTLTPADASPANPSAVVVLSHRSWQVRFGADPAVIGRTIELRGQPFEIVGVARAGFAGVDDVQPELWAPITMAARLDGDAQPWDAESRDLVSAVVRFRPGVSAEEGGAAVEEWLRAETADRLPSGRVIGVDVRSRATAQQLSPTALLQMSPILVAFALVLLAASANVASAMVARGVARQRELGTRLALGAGRGRLIRQLVTESLLLAMPAAIAGFLVSQLILAAASRFITTTMPAALQAITAMPPLDPDYRVFLFSVAVAFVCALLFGLVPAFQATHPRIVGAVRGGFRSGLRGSRLRQGLVVGQVTIAALLLVAAGVLLRGTGRTQHRDLGFEPRGALALDLDDRFRADALERIRGTVGVLAVAATTRVPMEHGLPRVGVAAGGGAPIAARSLSVSAEYFNAMAIDLVAGRRFSEAEGEAGAPVAIVSEALASSLWKGASVIDRMLALDPSLAAGPVPPASEPRTVRVIGVAQDAVSGWIGEPVDHPVVYLPLALGSPGARVVARVDGPASRAVAVLERTLTKLDPAALVELHTLEETIAFSIWPMRAMYWFAALVGAVSLLLTLTGVYGMLAFVVTQRTREIGIRAALGASRASLVRVVVSDSVKLAGLGIGLGLVLAAAVAWVAASRLDAVDPFEPAAYAGGALVVLLLCVLGAVVPSRRATRVTPLEALRTDG